MTYRIDYIVQDLCSRVINHVFQENATLRFKAKSFKEKKMEVKRLKEEFDFLLRDNVSQMFFQERITITDFLYVKGESLYRLALRIQQEIIPKIINHMFGDEYFYVKIRFNLIINNNQYHTVETDSINRNLPKIYYSRAKHKWQVCNHEFEVNQDSIYCSLCNHIFKSYGDK